MTKNNSNTAGVAAGLAALAATAAGTYYFFGGKKAAAHRRTAKAWADKAKKEVIKELSALEKVSKTNYEQAVAKVLKKYNTLKDTAPAEVTALTKELKGQWKNIEKHVKSAVASKAKKPVAKKKKPTKKK